jgi:hypothetical protein
MELFWPRQLKPFAAVVAIIGFVALGFCLRQSADPFSLPKLVVFMCFLGPMGLGLLFATRQRVRVYSDRIENHHFWHSRILDLPSTRVSKVLSNGFTLKDDSGAKIFISKWMIGSEGLFRYLTSQGTPNRLN